MEAHLEAGGVFGTGERGDGFPLLGDHFEHLRAAKREKLRRESKILHLAARGSEGGRRD